MSLQHATKHCPMCGAERICERPGPNHVLHLLLSLLTGGLWLFVWLVACLRVGGWHCTVCHTPLSDGRKRELTRVAACILWSSTVLPVIGLFLIGLTWCGPDGPAIGACLLTAVGLLLALIIISVVGLFYRI